MLWVGASDERSGEVATLTVQSVKRSVERGEPERLYLTIEAVDVLGNRRQVDLHFRPLSDPY